MLRNLSRGYSRKDLGLRCGGCFRAVLPVLQNCTGGGLCGLSRACACACAAGLGWGGEAMLSACSRSHRASACMNCQTHHSLTPRPACYCVGSLCSLLKEKRIKAGAHMKQLSQRMRQQRLQVGWAGGHTA